MKKIPIITEKPNSMKTIISTIVLSVIFISVNAQSITGKITDIDGEPIFYATAALYNQSDSTIVSAESTDVNGLFEIKKVKDGQYYLVISMLGYKEYMVSQVNIPSDTPTFYDVDMERDAALLSTVEIKEKLPLLEQKADKLIVNVADNITNTSGSLIDVMRKVPGMLVVNDRITMAGSGTPTILINGRSTQYMDIQSLLRDMPGDNIKKVEIIHQPGAEYEASGSGPILNIILKKNSLFGTNGSASIGVGKGELWDYNTGLNLSHYAGNINILGGLGYSRNAYVDELFLTRRLTTISEGVNGIYTQQNIDKATPATYRGNIRLDWDATDKHRLGIESKYYNNSNARISTNETNVDLTGPGAIDYRLDTDNDIDRSWTYLSVNPYYIFEIDTAGQKIEIDANISNYSIDGINTLTTINSVTSEIQKQRYTQPGDNDIFATSIDYTKPLSKVLELKSGLKYSKAALDNDLLSEFDQGGVWVNNINQTNRYLFDETVYAGYGKLSFVKNDWSGTAGLRYERSESVGTSETLDSTLTRNISQLFPSFSLSKKLGSILTSTVSYSYRIDRPRYSTLNPFVFFLDPFTAERGNPNIRPELTHSAKFTLSYEGQPFFNVEYKKSNNSIVEVTEQDPNSESAFKTDINFDDQTIFSGSLFFPLDFIPGISGYGGVILTQNSYNSFYLGELFERSQFNTTAFLQAEFKLPFDIDGEIGGWYTSGSQEGIFTAEYLYGTSFGLSKKIMDDKGKVSIGVEDFTNRFWNATVNFQQDMDLISTWQAPTVSVRFSYKFGNQHLKSKSKTSGSASEELRRASQG
jgi:ferric enterobactin receptor